MLLNAWLSAAKRCLVPGTGIRRIKPNSGHRRSQTELLESRSLLTALVINADNVSKYTNAQGGLEIKNTDITVANPDYDSLVIEGISISASSGNAVKINLSGIALESIAIESINVASYASSAVGFDIDLVGVTGLRTLAIEDVNIATSQSGRGIDLTLNNTTLTALTIDDSTVPGIRIDALSAANILNGTISGNTINAKSGIEGVLLNVTSATANNFRIEDNISISSPNRDYIKVNALNSPMNGLSISDNEKLGADTQGAGLLFRAEGDTFVQPFTLTNNSTNGELLKTFTFDLTSIGLRFDQTAATGLPFTLLPFDGTVGTAVTVTSSVVSADGRTLTVIFDSFDPGDQAKFRIDIDGASAAGQSDSSVFGDDLIGADIIAAFQGNGNRTVDGKMIGDSEVLTASQFAVGPAATGNANGINLVLSNSPLTNLTLTGNNVSGAPGNALLIDADTQSNITGVITRNEFNSSGRDGIRFDLQDSDFTGAVIGNNVSDNGGYGIAILPRVTRSGLVQAVLDGNPVTITSANHGLVTGDEIIIQGMVNHDTTVNHPANGRHTITKIDNNRFRVNGADGTALGVSYDGGGAWYKPEFQPDGSARGLVNIDMQTPVPGGTVTGASNTSDIVIDSPAHGLKAGQRVRVSNVKGNTAANGIFTVSIVNANRFKLLGSTGNGTFDDSTFGSWTTNVIEGATTGDPDGIVITSNGHGLNSGDEVRITGVLGNTAANGTYRVAKLDNNRFRLRGIRNDLTGAQDNAVVPGNGTYAGGGNWARLLSPPTAGAIALPQRMSENTITLNGTGGIFVDLTTGTRFEGDIVGNRVINTRNGMGIQIRSHSFGIGNDLPLDPSDPLALPSQKDVSFNVNIGTDSAGDGNLITGNKLAGVAIEALDYGSGSFEIRNNQISGTTDTAANAASATAVYHGEGIAVRLEKDLFNADAVALLSKSIIDGNTIGVDNLRNDGNGLLFKMGDRTRIQDLDLTNNTFLNSGRDGFHFERTEDADLSNVVIRKNRSTNNVGDGISLSATNTTRQQLDFIIGENVIDTNGAYGVRLEVTTDARIGIEFSQNSVTGNGATPTTDHPGYHPTTDGTGNTGSAGGIGVFAFQQGSLVLTGSDNTVDSNIGDGFSVDAFKFFDSLKFNMDLSNTTFNNNTLTGFRSHGASFGTWIWTGNQFSSNGEDGVRVVSIEDKEDFYERRVGGQNIEIRALRSEFSSNGFTSTGAINANGGNGARLGQGVSAAFGDGTDPNANFFDSNAADGLKITQSGGNYLAQLNQTVAGAGFLYQFRRQIGASRNYFRNNKGDGIDIGHFAQTEGGNVELGDEVITDTHVSINSAIITGNGGDGIEYLADSRLRLSPIIGGGQDSSGTSYERLNANNSSLSVTNSRVSSNAKRGIDILNRTGEDSVITIINNQIFSNKGEAIYVLNTAAHTQKQSDSSDPLEVYLEDTTRSDDDIRFFSEGTKQRQIVWEISPTIELRVQDNVIQSNGSRTGSSTVPVTQSALTNDGAALPNRDWAPDTRQVTGTLGGLVIRVGAVDSSGRFTRSGFSNFPLPENPEDPNITQLHYTANPNWELGLAGIDAEVFRNRFDGNVGADVYTDSFTSQIPKLTVMDFGDGPETQPIFWFDSDHDGYRDPLARLNMSFRENVGNSLDLTNGFAYLDNWEPDYKRRQGPGHSPPGDFVGVGFFRNQTRTLGMFNEIGDDFINELYYRPFFDDETFFGNYSYDGWGTSSFRVESDFETNRFSQTNPSLGFSDFYDSLEPSINNANIQWDTGTNVGGFVGSTPWSLQRGDIFNVKAGQTPIVGDSLEENDSFIGATDLGVVSGNAFSVNARAASSTLSIHTKRDRDYYSFVAGGSGAVDINVGQTDANGDDLVYMLYKIDSSMDREQVPLLQAANGEAQFVIVGAGSTGVLTATVEKGQKYVVEVFSDETENIADTSTLSDPISNAGKLNKFHYGTVRTYTLTIDAPALGAAAFPAVRASAAVSSASGSTNSGGSSVAAAVPTPISLPGAPTASFVPVTSDPRNTAVPSVTLKFSEDVTGVGLTDFKLMRGSVQIPLTEAAGVTLNQDTPSQYTLSLGTVTGTAGTYTLTLTASTSGIKDTSNVALAANATETFVVSNSLTVLTDSRDATIGDGSAKDSAGKTSLRSAVMESNATAGNDIIQLGSGTYTLSLAGRSEDESVTGDLDIHGNLTIRGVSARASIISAATIDRIFHVFSTGVLTLENLTLSRGTEFDGGAVFNEGTLILKNVNVINSEAYNQGGGVYNAGTLNAVNTSISLNKAGSRGGGVDNHGAATFVNTTFSTNEAVSRGGGLMNEGTATSTLTNVTITKNHAGAQGGGLATESTAQTTIGNTIIEANTTDPTLNVPVGGQNPADLRQFSDVMGTVTSTGYNLVGIVDASFDTGPDAGLLTTDQFGRTGATKTARLGSLTQGTGNGTWYHPLSSLSVNAIDKGNNSLFPTTPLLEQTDQSGNPRLIEGDLLGAVTIDLGASEYFVNKPLAVITATPNPAGPGEAVSFNGTGSTHTNPAAQRIVAWEWDFSYSGNPATFNIEATGSRVSHVFTTAGTYVVALRVRDNSTPTSATDIRTISIVVGPPAKPVITQPASVTTDSTPTFTWQNVTGKFSVTISRLNANGTVQTPPVIQATNILSQTYTPTTKLTPGSYQVVVTATNSAGSNSSTPFKFEVRTISLTKPTATSVTFDDTPLFQWVAVPNANRYEIQVNRTQPSAVSNVIRNSLVSTNSFQPATSLGVGTFTWWVRAFDAEDRAGDWSLGSSFSITQPKILTPGIATLNNKPTFSWQPVAGISGFRYELQVDQVGGTSRIIHQPALTTTSYTPTTALPNGTYKVRVRAVAADGEPGLWSPDQTFTMDFTKGPVLVSPSGIKTDGQPTFKWQAVEGVSTYELWVNDVTTSTAKRVFNVAGIPNNGVVNSSGIKEITYKHPTIVLPAGNYRWWVRATANAGTKSGTVSAWSTPLNFTLPSPKFTSPTSGQVLTTSTPLFRWTGLSEFRKYELWVNDSVTGDRVLTVSNITTTSYQTTLPLGKGTFKAWVRGYDAANNPSPFSTSIVFSIDVATNGAVGKTPSGGVAAGSRPEFTWTAPSGSSSFRLVIKQMTAAGQPDVFNQVITARVISTTNGISTYGYTPPVSLIAGQSYRWWIGTGAQPSYSLPIDFIAVSITDRSANAESFAAEAATDIVAPLWDVTPFSVTDSEQTRFTVHPAGVVIHRNAKELPPAESAATQSPVPATSELEQRIDDMMTHLAEGLFNTENGLATALSPASETLPVSTTEAAVFPASDTEKTRTAGIGQLMTGLLLAAFGRSARKISQSDDQKVSGIR